MNHLSLFYSRKPYLLLSSDLFHKWLEICHVYTLHNLTADDFFKKNSKESNYSFHLKYLSYPLIVKSNCFLTARLKFWCAIRQRKKLQYLSFYHDRLISKVEKTPISAASPIGLSKVSILQQKSVR